MFKKIKKNNKGFTLIEIIVVIVILAVLMAVAVPSVLNYVNEADDAKYMAQGRTVMNIAQTELVKAYTNDKKITQEEADKLNSVDTYGSGKNGMGNIKKVYFIYNGYNNDQVTVTISTGNSANTNITVSDSLPFNFINSHNEIPALPIIYGVLMQIDSKYIYAAPNDKIYVSDNPITVNNRNLFSY